MNTRERRVVGRTGLDSMDAALAAKGRSKYGAPEYLRSDTVLGIHREDRAAVAQREPDQRRFILNWQPVAERIVESRTDVSGTNV